MKKRLLFAFAMVLAATSGFAQSVGDYVYAAKGKYKITAEKTTGIVNAELNGWEAITAEEGEVAVTDQFTFTAAGMSSVKGQPTEGMTYALAGLDGATNYIVAVTIAQPEPAMTMHRAIQPWLCDHIKGDNDMNCMNILGVNMDDETDVVEYATPTEILPGEAKTYYYAITSDETGAARSYSLTLKGWAADLFISDIKVLEADPVGDERTVAAFLDHAKQLIALRDWKNDEKFMSKDGAQDVIDAIEENIEAAEEFIGNADTQVEEMEGAVEGLKESIADFEKLMDDFLPAAADKIPFEAPSKVQKVNNIGVWEGRGGGGGRIHANQGEPYDVGHYAGNTTWGYGNGMIGLTTRMDLEPGTYIFSMQTRAMMRLKSTSSCWDVDNAVKSVKGIFYVRPCADGDDAEFSTFDYDAEKGLAITYKELDMSCTDFEMNTLSFTITEETAGMYEFGIKTYAQEFAKDQKNGGTLELGDARIFAQTNNKYSKAQLNYEADVRGQIQAGRDNLTKAAENLANAETPWGKPALKEVADEIEPLIAAYEAKTQDEIIATMDPSTYDATKGLEAINEDESTEEEPVYYRGMASEVYRTVTKLIIAANNKFTAKNDTLASLGKSIAGAEDVLSFRIYDTATGKAGLQAAIAEAKTLDAAMKATEYSEENAAAIVEMIEKINAAIEELKVSIPASSITTLLDIDFDAYTVEAGGTPEVEDGTVDDLSVANYAVTLYGNVGSMYINSFSYVDTNTSCNIGIDSNGEVLRDGILRLGNAEGTSVWTAPEDAYGTDILRVTMDWWFGNLSGKEAGFYLKDENDENVGGLFCNRYNGTASYNPTGIFPDGVIGRGSSSQSNAAICEDGNLTHLEYIIDYGNKVAYCVSTLPTKVVTTNYAVLENANAVCKFLLKSNYNNNDRRCWFDNLKVERIKADPATVGIVEVNNTSAKSGKIYTISGMEVKKAVKGIYIMNGKKVVVK